MKPKKKVLPVFLLVASVAILFTACGAAAPARSVAYDEVAMDAGGAYDMKYAAAEESMMAPAVPDGYFGDDYSSNSYGVEAQEIQRMIIKNADLRISAEDPNQTLNEIMTLADEMGGYVVSSSVYQQEYDSGFYVNANITIRVPADDLDIALTTIEKKASQVLSQSVSGDDVTSEYVDLSSRLTNLENTEAELTRIMQDAQNTDDVLNVYYQLTSIREQIELTKGQMKYLQESSAMSSISINIEADEAVQPLTIGNWEPGGVAKDAIQALLNAVKFFVNAAIWIVLFLLPVLIILAIPVVVVVLIVRAIVKKNKAKKINKPKSEDIQE
ncbi:MAG: DUF4349 domain-containing protein [Anaerolineales bacterium]|nr:DUF4349 domain-containing protein [Anaerolineales bacterium]